MSSFSRLETTYQVSNKKTSFYNSKINSIANHAHMNWKSLSKTSKHNKIQLRKIFYTRDKHEKLNGDQIKQISKNSNKINIKNSKRNDSDKDSICQHSANPQIYLQEQQNSINKPIDQNRIINNKNQNIKQNPKQKDDTHRNFLNSEIKSFVVNSDKIGNLKKNIHHKSQSRQSKPTRVLATQLNDLRNNNHKVDLPLLIKKQQNMQRMNENLKQRPLTNRSSSFGLNKFKHLQLSSSMSFIKDSSQKLKISQPFQKRQLNSSRRISRTQSKISFSEQQKLEKNLTFREIEALFQNSQQKVSNLIDEKWSSVQKILQRVSAEEGSDVHKLSLVRLTSVQRIFDGELMRIIKKLKSLDLDSKELKESIQMMGKSEVEGRISVEMLESRRLALIEKILGQSMAQADIVKKFFSEINCKSILQSNLKIGQLDKNQLEILYQNSPSNTKRFIVNQEMEAQPAPLKSYLSNSTEMREHYKQPNVEDYEKYRYKQPNFMPKVQNLPRSTYQREFLECSGSNLNGIQKHKVSDNLIFPKTCPLKSNSSIYRNEFKQVVADNIDYRQLDAYQDKYKNLNISYAPKRRTISEQKSSRNEQNKIKYRNQVDYVKKLKSENKIDVSPAKLRLSKQMPKNAFLTQSRKQYFQKQSSEYSKSEIKHKNLYDIKYKLKMKYNL